MRTIAVLMHARPELAEACLTNLINCQDLDKFDKVLLSVDPGHRNFGLLREIAGAAARAIDQVVPCLALAHHSNLGIVEHPRAVLALAFEKLNSDLHVQVEDDALLKPDALRFALWYEQYAAENHDTVLASMCNHRAFGRKQLGEGIPELDPELVAETPYVTSPFAWATTAESWGFLRRWWSFKRVAPNAWSFSIAMGMRLREKVGVHPVLSRCQNVGRSGGTFESPESFDASQLGLTYREEPYHGPYTVRGRLDRSSLQVLDDWMGPEYERMKVEGLIRQ